MKKRHIALLATGGLVTTLLSIGHYFYRLTIDRHHHRSFLSKDHFQRRKQALETLNQRDYQDLYIESFDQKRLHAYSLPGTIDTYVICVHGYGSSALDMIHIAHSFQDLGYHVVLPDLRGHGQSEGDYIGMGYHDHFDLLYWMGDILKEAPQAHIVLYGVSMGATTIMLTTGEDLPENVIAAVEDCGYTTAMEEFSYQMNQQYHISSKIIIKLASLIAKLKADYFFEDVDALEALHLSLTPTLFIHGDQDDFVPYSMVHRLYQACSAQKALYVVEGAKHGCAYDKDPQKYMQVISDFIQQCQK